MKRTIEICASYSGTVNTGNYSNESPFFSLKEVVEIDDEQQDLLFDDGFIIIRHEELETMCRDGWKKEFDRIKSPPVKLEPAEDEKINSPTAVRKDTIVRMCIQMCDGDKEKAKLKYDAYSDTPTQNLRGKKLLEVYEKIAKDFYEWKKQNEESRLNGSDTTYTPENKTT